jgi:hypothetical protein
MPTYIRNNGQWATVSGASELSTTITASGNQVLYKNSTNTAVIGSNNLTFDGNFLRGGGRILEVSNTVSSSTTYTTTSGSFVPTGFNASITPRSSTNKILVMLTGQVFNNTPGCGVVYGISFNGTIITSSYGTYGGNSNSLSSVAQTFIHFPNTTSTCTYTVNIAVTGGGLAYWYGEGFGYYLTLMEVLV